MSVPLPPLPAKLRPSGTAPAEARAGRPADTPPTLVDRAYQHMLEMLVTVQIAPGERIAIDKVARQLGISQTPIREALSQLEAEKLVRKLPNVGYRASPQMTRDEVRDLYTLRLLIEPYGAARAAEGMDDDLLAALQEVERDMTAIADGDDHLYARFAESDMRLHRLIANGSGNRLIAETIDRLHAHLQIFRSLYATNAPTAAAAEHRSIIEALTARDPAGAEAALRHHLEQSQARMDRVLAGAGAAAG